MASQTRLRAIRRHVAPAAAERPYAELGSTSSEPLKLLTDAQMHEFIGQGFLTLGLDDLGAEFHEHLYGRAKEEFGPVNNGLRGTGGSTERIPELLTMVNSPVVGGALVSLLGPEYAHGHLGVAAGGARCTSPRWRTRSFTRTRSARLSWATAPVPSW